MTRVPASLEALLTRLIDYAGMFPPARLPLDEALEAYLTYRKGEDAWMLGHFIAAMVHIAPLCEQLRERNVEDAFPLVVLLRSEEVVREFLARLSEDSRWLAQHVGEHGSLTVPWVEGKIPLELLAHESSATLARFLVEASERVREHLPISRIFWEVPWGNNWGRWLDTFMDAAVQYGEVEGVRVGYKMRCGGEYPEQFPSVEQVATGVVLAREASVAFKATAGLHQPFRYFDTALGVYHHGFINLFAGAAFARTYRLSIDELIPVLLEEAPASFSFEEEAIRWQELQVPTEQVRASREHFALSFGSCSFEEPTEALRTRSLLTPLASKPS